MAGLRLFTIFGLPGMIEELGGMARMSKNGGAVVVWLYLKVWGRYGHILGVLKRDPLRLLLVRKAYRSPGNGGVSLRSK